MERAVARHVGPDQAVLSFEIAATCSRDCEGDYEGVACKGRGGRMRSGGPVKSCGG